MTDDDALSFAQYSLDRFLGHEITPDLLVNALSDWRREMDGKAPDETIIDFREVNPSGVSIEEVLTSLKHLRESEEVDEWYEGKRQMDEDSYRDEQ